MKVREKIEDLVFPHSYPIPTTIIDRIQSWNYLALKVPALGDRWIWSQWSWCRC